jgi:hypothetical protein
VAKLWIVVKEQLAHFITISEHFKLPYFINSMYFIFKSCDKNCTTVKSHNGPLDGYYVTEYGLLLEAYMGQ